jgi:hypothetical protein
MEDRILELHAIKYRHSLGRKDIKGKIYLKKI